MKISRKLGAIAASLALATSAHAATFDFEAETAGNKGASLTLTDSGLTMTITRIGGADVEVAFRSAYPAGWGVHALSPFLNSVSGGAFLLTFSSAISSISVDTGDFGADADVMTLTAGSGSASDSIGAGVSFPVFKTLSVSGVSTFTAVLSGGSSGFPQSVFWDNIKVTAVPEPGTYALMGLGLLGLSLAARRRRA